MVDSKLRGTLKGGDRVPKTSLNRIEQRTAERLNAGGGLGLSRAEQSLKRKEEKVEVAEEEQEGEVEGEAEKGPSWFDRASVRGSGGDA